MYLYSSAHIQNSYKYYFIVRIKFNYQIKIVANSIVPIRVKITFDIKNLLTTIKM